MISVCIICLHYGLITQSLIDEFIELKLVNGVIGTSKFGIHRIKFKKKKISLDYDLNRENLASIV
jgi:hypothetical protein